MRGSTCSRTDSRALADQLRFKEHSDYVGTPVVYSNEGHTRAGCFDTFVFARWRAGTSQAPAPMMVIQLIDQSTAFLIPLTSAQARTRTSRRHILFQFLGAQPPSPSLGSGASAYLPCANSPRLPPTPHTVSRAHLSSVGPSLAEKIAPVTLSKARAADEPVNWLASDGRGRAPTGRKLHSGKK